MTRALLGIYAGLMIYGLLTGHIGGGLIAMAMILLVCYAHRVFMQIDQEWENRQRNAHKPPAVTQLSGQVGIGQSDSKNRA